MDSPKAGHKDEAEEKLFGESNSSGSKVEIKFVADPKNGDTKIDISDVKQVFVGMGKEQLMQYANNPFWVRMRWFLFILFWALWFGMLAGAIAIILLAPKCSGPAPTKWYQESPIYHVNLKNFKDNSDDGIGDLAGLESKLDYFKDLGVETIMLDPIMQTADGTDDVVDFKSIDPNYGTFDDLKKLISSSKNKGLHLLMKIIPNFSSIQHAWFNKSVAGEEPFKNYYVWTDPVIDDYGDQVPRNNWLSVTGGSAWTYDKDRKQFYLHQFNKYQPDLNFRNSEVVQYFKEVYKFWLDHGFDGLYLDKVEYLVEDSDFSSEAAAGTVGKIHDEYEFLEPHARTSHLQESWDILTEWSEIFKSHSAIFAVSGVPDLKIADLIWRPINIKKSLTSADLESILLKRLNKTSQAWGFSCEDCDERVRVGLQAVLLMLPGAAIIPSGLELGLPPSSLFQWNSQSENHGFTTGQPWKPFLSGFEDKSIQSEKNNDGTYFTFKKIIKERRNPSFLQGITNMIHQKSVLAFTRSKVGSPHYLILFNLENADNTINLLPFFGNKVVDLTLIASISYNHSISEVKTTKHLDEYNSSLEVEGSSFAVYQYISNAE